MKTCKRCKTPKAPEDFPTHRRMRDGRENVCRTCRLASERKRLRPVASAAALSCLVQPNLVDVVYRADRRADLAEIGGLCGVREIRARCRIAREAKERRHGEEIPEAVLEQILPMPAAV